MSQYCISRVEACAASLGGRHEVARRETDARAEAFEDGARVI